VETIHDAAQELAAADSSAAASPLFVTAEEGLVPRD